MTAVRLEFDQYGEGRPLVLIHGFPLDRTVWTPLIKHLKSTFTIIVPDLRGFGTSPDAEGPYSIGDMAEDLADLLTSLHINRTYLAGHSMGGYAALAFAKKYPQRLEGLCLIGSQALADSPERKISRIETAERIMANGPEVVSDMSEKLTANKDYTAFLREIILRQRPAGLAGALKAMAERPDSTNDLQSMPGRIVLIHGMNDTLIPIERAREIKSVLPDAEVFELPTAGHCPWLDDTEATARAMMML